MPDSKKERTRAKLKETTIKRRSSNTAPHCCWGYIEQKRKKLSIFSVCFADTFCQINDIENLPIILTPSQSKITEWSSLSFMSHIKHEFVQIFRYLKYSFRKPDRPNIRFCCPKRKLQTKLSLGGDVLSIMHWLSAIVSQRADSSIKVSLFYFLLKSRLQLNRC